MADDEQFSLCWNNFKTNFAAGFHESLLRGDLVDVSLAAEGHIVKAHRLVLSVCSPFFRKMFTEMPSNTQAIVFLHNVSHSALKDLIQFMYCGEVNVKQDALPAFISTAESLQIKGLTDDVPVPQPPQEPRSPPPPAAPHVPAQRVQRQQPAASARYKIETVDDGMGDDNKGTTQRVQRQQPRASARYKIETVDDDEIVIQTTAAPQATIVQQPQQQQQEKSQIQTRSRSTIKRSAQRSSMTTTGSSVSGVKRSKTSVTANVIDPLDLTTETGTTTTTTQQLVPQQQQVHQQQQEEAEHIDLPMELPTEPEPDYSEDHGDAAGDDEGTYLEDYDYGNLRYNDSYFTDNEDAGNQSAANQSNTEAQDIIRQQGIMIVKGVKGKTKLVKDGYEYYKNNSRGSKTYWLCAKNRYMRCGARIITCSATGELTIKNRFHNHNAPNQPLAESSESRRLPDLLSFPFSRTDRRTD